MNFFRRFLNAFWTAWDESCSHIPATKTAKEKGDEFEHYIIKLFDLRHFVIKEMRSDKGVAGHYAESNRYPDLLMEYKHKGELFAVECKWRARWWQHSGQPSPYIEWTGAGIKKGKEKIEVYRSYGEKQNVPVFVAIGIGGEPSAPDELYLTPLERLKFPRAKQCYLKRFARPTDKNFFFDPEKKLLK